MANEQVKIDSDVPMPESRTQSKKWPLDTMKVGQSFLMPGREAGKVRSSFYHRAKALKITLRIANVIEGDVKGVRVWRSE
jgi:hypothetical protein